MEVPHLKCCLFCDTKENPHDSNARVQLPVPLRSIHFYQEAAAATPPSESHSTLQLTSCERLRSFTLSSLSKLPHSCEVTHRNLSILLMTCPLLIIVNTPVIVQTWKKTPSGWILVTTQRSHAIVFTQLPHCHRHPHSTEMKGVEGEKKTCCKYSIY